MNWDIANDLKMSRKQQETRRILAANDLLLGMAQVDVAEKYSVSKSSVSKWAKTIREEGINGLKLKKPSGRSPKLTDEQSEELVEILAKGAIKSGFETDSWNGKRVAEVIKNKFNVDYHFKHIPKLLRKLGFRKVKPKRKYFEQDESKREEWLETTWEYVKKN